jgi:hypothetical protein
MRRLLLLAVLGLAQPALAQSPEIDRTKLYVADPASCAAIEADGIAGIGEGLALSFADGIQSFEFHCAFFDVKSREGSPFLLVEAVCEEPGLRFPDLISISPYEADTIEVVSLHDSHALDPTDDNPDPGVTIYTRCDDLDGLPR